MYHSEILYPDNEITTWGYKIVRVGRVRAKGLGYATRAEAEREAEKSLRMQKEMDEASL